MGSSTDNEKRVGIVYVRQFFRIRHDNVSKQLWFGGPMMVG